ALARQKEVSIRIALGASRWRLVKQFLVESILFSLIGGILGLALAYALLQLLGSLMPPFTLPNESQISMDYRMLLFTFGITLGAGIVFGSVPAWHSSEPNLSDAVKEGGRGSTAGVGRHRIRSGLVIAEVAIALVLLVGAGLLINSFIKLQHVNPGFQPQNIL